MKKQEKDVKLLNELRDWVELALSIPQLNPGDVFKREQALKIADIESQKSILKGIRCLEVGIGEIIALTQDLVTNEIDSINGVFEKSSILNYSAMVISYSKSIRKILTRGQIKSNKEFELIQSYKDSPMSDNDRRAVELLIANYEQHVLKKN